MHSSKELVRKECALRGISLPFLLRPTAVHLQKRRVTKFLQPKVLLCYFIF